MSSIISLVLPILGRLITNYFLSQDEKSRQYKAWMNFIQSMAKDSSGESERLRTSYKKQLAKLRQNQLAETKTDKHH